MSDHVTTQERSTSFQARFELVMMLLMAVCILGSAVVNYHKLFTPYLYATILWVLLVFVSPVLCLLFLYFSSLLTRTPSLERIRAGSLGDQGKIPQWWTRLAVDRTAKGWLVRAICSLSVISAYLAVFSSGCVLSAGLASTFWFVPSEYEPVSGGPAQLEKYWWGLFLLPVSFLMSYLVLQVTLLVTAPWVKNDQIFIIQIPDEPDWRAGLSEEEIGEEERRRAERAEAERQERIREASRFDAESREERRREEEAAQRKLKADEAEERRRNIRLP